MWLEIVEMLGGMCHDSVDKRYSCKILLDKNTLGFVILPLTRSGTLETYTHLLLLNNLL